LNIAAAAPADIDLARLEAALALVNQDGSTCAGVEYGAFRDREHRGRRASLDFRIDIHFRAQHLIGVWQLDADASRAGLGHQMRINQRHFARESLAAEPPR